MELYFRAPAIEMAPVSPNLFSVRATRPGNWQADPSGINYWLRLASAAWPRNSLERSALVIVVLTLRASESTVAPSSPILFPACGRGEHHVESLPHSTLRAPVPLTAKVQDLDAIVQFQRIRDGSGPRGVNVVA